MRTFSEDLLESLTDDELLRGQGELAELVARRGKLAALHDRLERGTEPNKWEHLELNKTTLRNMGRDSRGAPLPPKVKKV